MAAYVFVLAVGLMAGAVSGVIGTGASIMLMPVLVFEFGPKQAVPVMAIAALMSNVGKLAAWWREVDWRAFAAYAVPGIPAAAAGARTLLVLPPRLVDLALGAFYLAMVPARRWLQRRHFTIGLGRLALAGAGIGFVTGIVISTGPLSVPAFLAFGLAKGAFLSTEAASSLALFVSKVATFRQFGALPVPSILEGLIIGSAVMAGTFLGKAIVLRISLATFQNLLDGLLLCSGLALLAAAIMP
jgi:uncharacterized membrane protein YfcA